MNCSTSTSDRLVLSTESISESSIIIPGQQRSKKPQGPTKKKIQGAIYSYIRALRALGRTTIDTAEIAEALSIRIAEVNRAVSALKKKGVKTLNV